MFLIRFFAHRLRLLSAWALERAQVALRQVDMQDVQDPGAGHMLRAAVAAARLQEATGTAAAAAANAAMPPPPPRGQDEEPMFVPMQGYGVPPAAPLPQPQPGYGGHSSKVTGGRGQKQGGKQPKQNQQQNQQSVPGHLNWDAAAAAAAAGGFGMGFAPPHAGLGVPTPFGMFQHAPLMSPQMVNPYMFPGMDPSAGFAGGMHPAMAPMMMYPGGMHPSMPHVGSPLAHHAFGGKSQPRPAVPGHLQPKQQQRKRGGKPKGKDRATSPDTKEDSALSAPRSPELNELRNQGGNAHFSIPQLLPLVAEFAQDQIGARYLVNRLDDGNAVDRQEILEAILPVSGVLAGDVSGNNVIQKYFDIGTTEQKKQLTVAMLPEMIKLSTETYGCRVVQKAIQHVPRETQLMIADKLKKNVVGCIDNMHGNHVIQKCIEQMPPDSVTFIIKAIEDQTEKMAMNMYGCRVIQRLLEHCASHQLRGMLDRILDNVCKLAQDSYGNYVIQHVLEHGRKEDKQRVIAVIKTDVGEYSKHKCSSNVVEKCFEIATIGEHAQGLEEERHALTSAVLGLPGDPDAPINYMMEDRYGNYIVQRMIEHSRGAEREFLKHKIEALTPLLRQSTIGKHIIEAKQKEFGT